MSILRAKFEDRLFTTGIIFILLSLFIFCLPWLFSFTMESYAGFFLLNFFFTVIYFVIVMAKRPSGCPEHKQHYLFLFLILMLISAYSLNREMVVFSSSPVWLCVLLVLLCANYVAGFFFGQMPQWARSVHFFLLGVATAFFLYLSLYLLPLYPVSAIGMIALGISSHTFAPVLFFIYTLLMAGRLAEGRSKYWLFFAGGIAFVLAVTITFVVNWNIGVRTINRTYSHALSEGSRNIPAWIQVAQRMDANSITEKIMKTGLVYTIPRWDNIGFWNMPRRSFGEGQQFHDPLVVTASLFAGRVHIGNDQRINILKSQFNSRHQAEEKLWSGKDLRTANVLSNVRIWPQIHLAYTEKTITVFNHSEGRRAGNQQEALYTFHLPEGAVVTSLSLWINDKEEKGILTTKGKADTAYRTIVGVEARDPSVVQWQEGNRVTVRVFPVVGGGSRLFKIGITAPLRKEGDQLVYDNIWFDGPDPSSAEENMKVELDSPVKEWVRKASFESGNDRSFTRSGRYRQHWSFAIKEEGLAPKVFSFNGHSYSLKPYRPERSPMELSDVYLDVNESWSEDEWESIWKMVKDKRVWICHDEPTRVTEDNRMQLFKDMKRLRFTLFPLFVINDPEHSLLVSKTGAATPNLSDLQGCDFLNELKLYSSEGRKIKLFNIGQQLSPYLSSLKEYRSFAYESGDMLLLRDLLSSREFAVNRENDNEVVVHSAGISLVKQQGEKPSDAPDHLMRLFAYNHIMQSVGKQGLNFAYGDSSLVAEAQEAYVVSPVSSLVVLEKQEDYDRFGIKDSEKSLKNASAASKGAVPEPNEWFMIILVAGTGLYLLLKSRM